MNIIQPEDTFSDRTVLHLERTGNEDLVVAQMLVSARQTFITSGGAMNMIEPEDAFSDRTVLHMERTGNEDVIVPQLPVTSGGSMNMIEPEDAFSDRPVMHMERTGNEDLILPQLPVTSGGTVNIIQPEDGFTGRTVLHLERTGIEDVFVAQMVVSARQTFIISVFTGGTLNEAHPENLFPDRRQEENKLDHPAFFYHNYKASGTRKRGNFTHPDEGWEDWPALGEGWRRREIVRRSGVSVGKTDVYYLSPHGDRLRSGVELALWFGDSLDLSMFHFNSGRFLSNKAAAKRVKRTLPRIQLGQADHRMQEVGEGGNPDGDAEKHSGELEPNRLHMRKREARCRSSYKKFHDLVCFKCGQLFAGRWHDKVLKRPYCHSCRVLKPREPSLIRFRKWIPCGQCVACRNTVNCGQCVNCMHGPDWPLFRRICKKRKCICPIRKRFSIQLGQADHRMQEVGEGGKTDGDAEKHSGELEPNRFPIFQRKSRKCGSCQACLFKTDCGTCDFCKDKLKFGGRNTQRQKCRLRQCHSLANRFLLPRIELGQADLGMQEVGVGDGRNTDRDAETHPGEEPESFPSANHGMQEVGNRTGEQEENSSPIGQATDGMQDVGTQTGMNSVKLEEKSFPIGQADHGMQEGPIITGTFSMADDGGKSNIDGVAQCLSVKPEEKSCPIDQGDHGMQEGPIIAGICSLAESSAGSGPDGDEQLLVLLRALRAATLPQLWSAILVEKKGPQLQLIQCAQESSMADTMVLIDPDFRYRVTVLKQPLSLTHPLYAHHPSRLNSVAAVVRLLLGLEKYSVCQVLGFSERPSPHSGLIILERVTTACDLLVKGKAQSCVYCKALWG